MRAIGLDRLVHGSWFMVLRRRVMVVGIRSLDSRRWLERTDALIDIGTSLSLGEGTCG